MLLSLSLWDKLALSNADNTEQERLAMNRLGAAIIMVRMVLISSFSGDVTFFASDKLGVSCCTRDVWFHSF